MEQKHWGIVGGGIMGMTLAHRLSQQGHKVTLFEAAPELGGLVSPWKMNDVEWDKFYHVILLSDSRTRNILQEIGLDDKIEWVETKTGFYMNGKLYSMSDTVEFLKFPTLNLVDKFRLGLTILVASKIKDWKRLEKVPVTDWLKRWSGRRTFNKIWLPLLRAKLGESYEKTSAVFIWATIQRLYGARRSGLKKEMFGYVPGGYKKVIEMFKQKLLSEGVNVRTSYPAKEVSISSKGKPTIEFGNGAPQEFDEVKARYQAAVAHRDRTQAGQAQAKAALAQAHTSFSYTRIVAPFDGVITEKKADPGTLASPGIPIFVIEGMGHYRLEATVNENDLRFVRMGQQVPVVVDALQNPELKGKVTQIVPAADPGSRSFLVKIELPSDAQLRSGLFGRAQFSRGQRSSFVIPRTAVVERGQLQGVYVLDQNKVAGLRYVTLGKTSGPQVEVLAGLQEGERLVVQPGLLDWSGKRIEAQ